MQAVGCRGQGMGTVLADACCERLGGLWEGLVSSFNIGAAPKLD